VSTRSRRRQAAILAVDSGNSKIDAVLLTARGEVLGWARGHGASFAPDDHERSVAELVATVREAREKAGIDPSTEPLARVGAFCVAGADLPADDRRLIRAFGDLGLAEDIIVRNDTFAVLRAGTERDWGIGVVCGTGLNCSGVGPSGRIVRYAALGLISGDEGGGGWLAEMGVGSAVRGRDGRGARTELERVIPGHFGLRTPLAVVEAFHTGRLHRSRMVEVPPIVLQCASAGDEVAGNLVDLLADELVLMATSAIRRLRLTRVDVDVVLGGGIVRAGNGRFMERVRGGILAVAPKAVLRPLTGPPVAGAALLGLDRARAGAAAKRRLRDSLAGETLVHPPTRRKRVANRPG
jgi:N-acetylglucosamine kinase-like BadF-type ATPase